MEDIEQQRQNNILLDSVLAKINEQERNNQQLKLIHQNMEHERNINMLIRRNENLKEKKKKFKKSIKKILS